MVNFTIKWRLAMKKLSCKCTYLSVVMAIMVVLALAPSAGAVLQTYSVQHNFTLNTFNPFLPNIAVGSHWESAWVADPNYRWASKSGSYFIPPGGSTNTFTAYVPPGPNSAQANSTITVNPYWFGSSITGSIRAFGFANAVAVNSQADARSSATVRVWGPWAILWGGFNWWPILSDTVAGGAHASGPRRVRDPISYGIFDPDTGLSASGTLLDIDGIFKGLSTYSWDSTTGDFSINAPAASGNDVDFRIDQTNTQLSNRGWLDLQVRDGVVTYSNDWGSFDGVLPAVGTSADALSLTLGSINSDYDLRNGWGPNTEAWIEFGGSNVPLPSSLSLLLLGGGMLFSYRCWRGR
jgi:hypothetical protein